MELAGAKHNMDHQSISKQKMTITNMGWLYYPAIHCTQTVWSCNPYNHLHGPGCFVYFCFETGYVLVHSSANTQAELFRGPETEDKQEVKDTFLRWQNVHWIMVTNSHFLAMPFSYKPSNTTYFPKFVQSQVLLPARTNGTQPVI